MFNATLDRPAELLLLPSSPLSEETPCLVQQEALVTGGAGPVVGGVSDRSTHLLHLLTQ